MLKLSTRERSRTTRIYKKKEKKRIKKENKQYDNTTWFYDPTIRRKNHQRIQECICGGPKENVYLVRSGTEMYVECDNCGTKTQIFNNQYTSKVVANWNILTEQLKTEQLANKSW